VEKLKQSLRRLSGLVRQPAVYFADPSDTFLDGVLVVSLLFLVTFAQKILWFEPGIPQLSPWAALSQAFINSLMVWSLYCVFFFAISGAFRRGANLVTLSGQVGAAGLPLVGVVLFSFLTWLGALLWPVLTAQSWWLPMQNILNWLGLALSWPGVYGYFLLRHSLKLSRLWASVLLLLALAFLVSGEFLPLLK
jgi:hypothetical protein